MRYENTTQGIFMERPNRFIAKVEIDGAAHTVHVKNTGRCKELLVPGCCVVLEKSSNPNRKTKYDLIATYKQYPSGKCALFNMDSQAPNKVVGEWLSNATCRELCEIFPLPNTDASAFSYIKPEYTYGDSRVDFYAESPNCDSKFLLEVKGCTLEIDGVGYFPDAPTERGVKHLKELTKSIAFGYNAAIAFVIQTEGVTEVYPNEGTHPEFGEALRAAAKAGVRVLYLPCRVTEDSLEVTGVIDGTSNFL